MKNLRTVSLSFLRLMPVALVLLLGASVPAMASSYCAGDCDSNGLVDVSELTTGVGILLGEQTIDACPSFDLNDDGNVHIAEIVTAIIHALEGCPPLPLEARGSVEQVHVSNAYPDQGVDLLDGAEQIVMSGTADEQGTVIFREVLPGSGYVAAAGIGAGQRLSEIWASYSSRQ